jgi:hypothetical protein
VCSSPDPIISVVSEEIGDCEFWGGLSGCTSGYAKRITRRMSDSSLKVSYSCCNPLDPNLKYYCTLRPFSTGQCLNELKSTDFTGVVVAGQGEWVCEELGITSYPSCSTAENCNVPKTTSSTYESCGYLNTGQRLVTTNTYQSWCVKTLETVIGDCVGADDPCGGKYCGDGSGEEEYAISTSTCPSGSAIRYKCLTPEGCAVKYTFRRCTAYTPPVVIGDVFQQIYYITEVCRNALGSAISCNQYSSYTVPASTSSCTVTSSTSSYSPCPQITTNPTGPTAPTGPTGPSGCGCIDDDAGYCNNGVWYQYQYDPNPACPNCPARNTGGSCISESLPAQCNGTCVYGSGTQSCGIGGTQTYCITAVGCPDIYGPCIVPGSGATTPTEPPPSNPTGPTFTVVPGTTVTSPGPTGDTGGTTTWTTTQTTDGGSVLNLIDDTTGQTINTEPIVFPPPNEFFNIGGGGTGKSININTLVRTRDGLVPAFDLKVGDKLLSADIDTFPYDNLLTTDMELIEWTAQNPHINLVETEIVNLRTRISKWAIIVDSDIFSDTHYILVNRNDVTKFVKAIDLESTDLIWSNTYHNWVAIGVLRKVDVDHEVVSIDCEPYDIFFTERMLTHDSNTVD